MSLNQTLRDITLGAKKQFRTKEIEYEGHKFQFTQLTYKERKELIARSKEADGELDNTKFQINAVIYMTVDPASGKKVFSRADFDSLMESPAGGFVDTFSEAALSLLGPEVDEASGKEQEV